MKKVIIVVAPVSGKPIKGVSNPLSPEEIAEDVILCSESGASVVHLHVRDAEGNASYNTTIFSNTIKLIRKKSDIIINGSTGGFAPLTKEERCVSLQEDSVELATLNVGSVNYNDTVFANPFPDVRYWAKFILEKNKHPELEIFDAGMINNVKILADEGYLKPPFSFAFCPGVFGGIPALPDTIFFMKNMLPPESIWGINHANMQDFSLLLTSLSMGASFVRVGFEDGFFYKPGHVAKTNSELVKRLAFLIKEIGYEIASPNEAREIIGIKKYIL